VAVLKHSHKDVLTASGLAYAYRQAGAQAVAQAGLHLVQVNRYAPGEPDPAEILAFLTRQADLVIVEGYKQSPLPKIALVGPDLENIPLDQSRVVAWVSRGAMVSSVPVFHPDQVEEIGAFILDFLGMVAKRTEN
jgi:molybdopterin-guanine dinucleotide biosynthesis protein B